MNKDSTGMIKLAPKYVTSSIARDDADSREEADLYIKKLAKVGDHE